VARFRLAQLAQNDLANILATSAERGGTKGRRRYASLLAAAMRVVAANPEGPLTQARNELSPGLRSIHLRHAVWDLFDDSRHWLRYCAGTIKSSLSRQSRDY
jgi:plasmid stabilization system protein ParE